MLGGISSGQEIVVSIALKPTSSITVPGATIDVEGRAAEIATTGRHDPCVGIRATPIAEAMMAIVLMDHYLRHRAQCADVVGPTPVITRGARERAANAAHRRGRRREPDRRGADRGAARAQISAARSCMRSTMGATSAGRSAEDEAAERDLKLQISDVAAFDFSRVDLAFFCGRAALGERYAEAAAGHAWVIDGSAAFRARADVPLVAADVNAARSMRTRPRGLVALPGSASVALATALAPLHAAAGLVRVEVATYQAVSGSGRAAMDELAGETVAMLSGRPARGRAFGRQIAFNVIPQVDALEEDGASREERRLWEETRRVLDLPLLEINATAVRVPVFFGHGLAVHAALRRAR